MLPKETMLSLIGIVVSSMPRMSLTIVVFSHFYLNHVNIGRVYEVSLTGRKEGQRHCANYDDG